MASFFDPAERQAAIEEAFVLMGTDPAEAAAKAEPIATVLNAAFPDPITVDGLMGFLSQWFALQAATTNDLVVLISTPIPAGGDFADGGVLAKLEDLNTRLEAFERIGE